MNPRWYKLIIRKLSTDRQLWQHASRTIYRLNMDNAHYQKSLRIEVMVIQVISKDRKKGGKLFQRSSKVASNSREAIEDKTLRKNIDKYFL